MFRTTFFLCLIASFLTTCKGNGPIPKFSGSDYFPLNSGFYIEFEVRKTRFSLASEPEIDYYHLRQAIRDSFLNSANQMVFLLENAVLNKNSEWQIDSTSIIWKTQDKALGIESGKTIIKLAFPLYERNVWNGNAYNSLGETWFEVRDVGKPMQVGSLFFPKTATVIRQNDSTLLSQNRYIEVYAEGIGLIKKELSFIHFCYDADCVGKGIIKTGWKETSMIKKFGR